MAWPHLTRDLDRAVRDAEPCMCGALDCRACRGGAAEVDEEDEIETEPDDDIGEDEQRF